MNETPMRRKDRELSEADARAVLETAEYGFLATVGADGEPYGVPISFVFIRGAIYVHCASEGRKIENFRFRAGVQLTAVRNVRAVFTHNFTTFYESAMAFGKISPVEDEAEKTEALRALCEKYLPKFAHLADEHIARSRERTAVWRIDVEKLSGKAKR